MPCLGLTSFLHQELVNFVGAVIIRVNALSRANLISTDRRRRSKNRQLRPVSMPCLGLTSFLHYSGINSRKEFIIGRVNALSQANLISTFEELFDAPANVLVSMPCLGLTSFLLIDPPYYGQGKRLCVNALSRTNLISTSMAKEAMRTAEEVCQCPVSG